MKIIQGDLLKLADAGEFDVIVHGCNCFNTMGAGIAYTISKKYPSAFQVDNETIRGDETKLGTYTQCKVLTKTDPVKVFRIVNAYTQNSYSRYGGDAFEYEAFEKILNKLSEEFPNTRIGFPKIGCGLSGGDEPRILKMIEDFSNNFSGDVTVVEFKN